MVANPTLHVRRAKKGTPSANPIPGDELRALRKLQRNTTGAFVFETERGGPFTASAINRLIKRIGDRASFEFMVHAHMLRHACGYALANRGHDTPSAASLSRPQRPNRSLKDGRPQSACTSHCRYVAYRGALSRGCDQMRVRDSLNAPPLACHHPGRQLGKRIHGHD